MEVYLTEKEKEIFEKALVGEAKGDVTDRKVVENIRKLLKKEIEEEIPSGLYVLTRYTSGPGGTEIFADIRMPKQEMSQINRDLSILMVRMSLRPKEDKVVSMITYDGNKAGVDFLRKELPKFPVIKDKVDNHEKVIKEIGKALKKNKKKIEDAIKPLTEEVINEEKAREQLMKIKKDMGDWKLNKRERRAFAEWRKEIDGATFILSIANTRGGGFNVRMSAKQGRKRPEMMRDIKGVESDDPDEIKKAVKDFMNMKDDKLIKAAKRDGIINEGSEE